MSSSQRKQLMTKGFLYFAVVLVLADEAAAPLDQRSPQLVPVSGAPNATARRRNGRRSQAAAAANSTPSATGTGRSRASPPTFERGEAVIVAATISQTSSQGCSTMTKPSAAPRPSGE